jgi:hypothetical protein
MTNQSARDDLLSHFRSIRSELRAALDGLSEAQMLERTIDGWSIKDHLAHMAFWDELRAGDIERVSAGYESAWPMTVDSQRLNDIVQEARANLSLKQVMLEFETNRQRVLDAVAAATPRGLDPSLYGEPALRTDHDIAHADYIRSWRQQRGY